MIVGLNSITVVQICVCFLMTYNLHAPYHCSSSLFILSHMLPQTINIKS
jgi:hypothetical protein